MVIPGFARGTVITNVKLLAWDYDVLVPVVSGRVTAGWFKRVLVLCCIAAPLRAVPAAETLPPTAGGEPLREAMDRAAACCLAWLDPDRHFLPTGGYETAHDTGRWWDAMLRHEAATGTPIPDRLETAMLANLRSAGDNPAALLTSDRCNPHNLRESLLAYTALVRHRNSAWAAEWGRRLVETMAGLIDTDGQMDYGGLARRAGVPLTDDASMTQRSAAGDWFNSVCTTGRSIEALVLFHEATGDAAALDLAGRLAEVHLRTAVDPAGRVRAELLAPDCVSHTHSYCGTLRGLLLYGLSTGDRRFIDAVARTYRNGLWGTAISHSGWTPHDQGKIRFPDAAGDPVGEHASCGDVAQLALWLAIRDGQVDLLDDVERLVRARLLPAQLRDPSVPRNDGAWGVYSHPFGRGSMLDVFAAVLHSLVDIHRHAVTTAPDGTVAVNLHFDTHTPIVTVRSRRAAHATLSITLAEDRPLRIRVPGWAPRDSVRLTVQGTAVPLRWDGPSLVIDRGAVGPGRPILLQYDLPKKQTVETMPVSRRTFRLTWRGDEVVACEPPVPIYPAAAPADAKP